LHRIIQTTIEMAEQTYTYKYPHPAVTTDCVIFGFDGKDMHVLLIERGIDPYKGAWALPGGFINMDETVEQGAMRELWEETGVKDVFLEQLHVFSDVKRDPRERVITVAFYALVRKSDYKVIGGDDASDADWFKWDELPPLAFDHADIIKMARQRLQERLHTTPLAFKLLDEKFKMSELQRLYELINDTQYDRRNFNRKMMSSGVLDFQGLNPEREPNRAAQLYSFDADSYEKEKKKKGGRWFPFDL